jgi:hypothetical protein
MDLLDTWIIARVTVFAHAFQRWTGRTCFWLAKCCLVVFVFVLMINVFDYFVPLLEARAGLVGLIINVPASIFWMTQVKRLEDIDRHARSTAGTLPAWVLAHRQAPAWLRLGLVSLTILDLGLIVNYWVQGHALWLLNTLDRSGMPAFMLAEYLIHVNPLPPGTSKVRQWITGMFTMVPAYAER